MSRRIYAHMCRDGHVEIGHNDSGDDERCPVCRLADHTEQARDVLRMAEETISSYVHMGSAKGALRQSSALLEAVLPKIKLLLESLPEPRS